MFEIFADLFVIGLTLSALGKVMLGMTVLVVHWRVLKDHRIDEDVLREMRREQVVGIIAVLLVITGYTLQMISLT